MPKKGDHVVFLYHWSHLVTPSLFTSNVLPWSVDQVKMSHAILQSEHKGMNQARDTRKQQQICTL